MADFLLGAATAAHQVEGNNIFSDSWAQEQMKNSAYAEPSLDACDHYHRYEEDIRYLADAGLSAYRFSVEWARIEPEEGRFDEAEVAHYRAVIRFCRQNGVEPIVTLHHFSSPKWLIKKGGWDADTVVEDFSRYVRYVMEHLGDELTYVCTINEANMRLQIGAIAREFMKKMQAQTETASGLGSPGNNDSADSVKSGNISGAADNMIDTEKEVPLATEKPGEGNEAAIRPDGTVQLGIDLEKMMTGQTEAARETMEVFGVSVPKTFFTPCDKHGDDLIMQAHQAAVAVIRECAPHVKAGITLSLHDIQALPGGEKNAKKEWEEEFLHYLPALQGDDFIGVQNYTRSLYGAEGKLPNPEGARLTQSGYEYYPQALEHVIRAVAKDFSGDIIVTENGIATADDADRVAFLKEATAGVATCIADGIPVRGYLHWSLLDNFEWQKGFGMTFGLIAVDHGTQTRTVKPSLWALGAQQKLFC